MKLDLVTVGALLPSLPADSFAVAADGSVSTGFPGFVMSYIVEQPAEVTAALGAAERDGSKMLKPPKKSLFAGFSGVCQAPDGTVWKVASEHRKDTGPAADPPAPTEIGVLLGVAEPKRSKEFYVALGMTADRDYGSKYVDFTPAAGRCRLAFMQRPVLAKDAGIDPAGPAFGGLALTAATGGPGALLAAAEKAGGRRTGDDSFTDPDGVPWRVIAA